MSTPNARVTGMVSLSSGRSGCRYNNPVDNMSTNEMIACTIGNRSSRHGYLDNNTSHNRSISHGDPTDSASTASAGNPKIVYARKNQYHISIIQSDFFLDCMEEESRVLSANLLSGFYQRQPQCVRFDHNRG